MTMRLVTMIQCTRCGKLRQLSRPCEYCGDGKKLTPKCKKCPHRKGSHSKRGCIFCGCRVKGDFKI